VSTVGAPASDEPPPATASTVSVFDEQDDEPVDLARWARLARAALAEEGAPDAEVTVLFVDEAHMAELNERFMGVAGPTDVLAFPIDEAGAPGPADPTEVPRMLGDVVICPAVARRNAPDHAGTYEDELALLLVHGLLHLLGHDHADESERALMQARETVLLERFHR
jgi:probable rRNA maturation factor